MSKQAYFYFGSGLPGQYTGLSPTFIAFNMGGITAIAAPGITEFATAGMTGVYGFQFGATASVAFIIDGGSTLTSSNIRYIVGNLDPVLSIDQSIGYQTDSFGNTATDPTTLFGQAKRNQEFNEGDKAFAVSTGYWDNFNRGSTTLLFEKVLSTGPNGSTSVL